MQLQSWDLIFGNWSPNSILLVLYHLPQRVGVQGLGIQGFSTLEGHFHATSLNSCFLHTLSCGSFPRLLCFATSPSVFFISFSPFGSVKKVISFVVVVAVTTLTLRPALLTKF